MQRRGQHQAGAARKGGKNQVPFHMGYILVFYRFGHPPRCGPGVHAFIDNPIHRKLHPF